MSEDIEQFEQQVLADRTVAVQQYFMQLRQFVMATTVPNNLADVQVSLMFRYDDGTGINLAFTITPKAMRDDETPASTDATLKPQ